MVDATHRIRCGAPWGSMVMLPPVRRKRHLASIEAYKRARRLGFLTIRRPAERAPAKPLRKNLREITKQNALVTKRVRRSANNPFRKIQRGAASAAGDSNGRGWEPGQIEIGRRGDGGNDAVSTEPCYRRRGDGYVPLRWGDEWRSRQDSGLRDRPTQVRTSKRAPLRGHLLGRAASLHRSLQ